MTGGRVTKGFLALSLVLLFAWAGGFLAFVEHVRAYVEPTIDGGLTRTDAIIVLTGGSERLNAGFDLLREGKGQKLLISGVYPGVRMEKFAGASDLPQEIKDCCIVLGHTADNTRGNAAEARDFMGRERFKSLRLVTAHYHMPRSLFLFGHLMPEDIRIEPFPVSPDTVDLNGWWFRPGSAGLLMLEYTKFLFAYVRVWGGFW